MRVRHVMFAMCLGGVAGLWLGAAPQPPDVRLLDDAEHALTGDLQTADVDRALAAVDRYLDAAPGSTAGVSLRDRLVRQRRCRQTFDRGQHALAMGDLGSSVDLLAQVGPDCRLHPFAQTLLEQLPSSP